jgi:steroid delta-isomerase-like uncharacterized protein
MKRSLSLTALAALMLLMVSACGGSSQVAEEEAMVQEWVVAVKSLDLEKTMTCYADDVIYQDPAYQYRFTGGDEVRSMYMDVYALPDVKFDVTSAFVSGDGKWAAAEWTWSGTKGGKGYSIPGVSIFEIRGNKIVRETIYYDKTSSPY